MIEMPEHYKAMVKLLSKGYDVVEASNKAFTQVTGRPKRRRMRKAKVVK